MRLTSHHASAPDSAPRYKRKWLYHPLVFIPAAALLTLAVFAAWLWRQPLIDQAINATADAGLRLEHIAVHGRLNTSHEEIYLAVGLEPNSPILNADLNAIRERLKGLGWIENASVLRQFPSTLRIYLEERQALALHQTQKGHQVIDKTGAVIHSAKAENFPHLPVISGKNAAGKAHAIISALETEADLYNEVWSLSLLSERRWDVYLSNDIRIMLPEEKPLEAWQRLAALDRKHKITKRNTVNIDLRIAGQIIIKPDRSAKPEGNET